MPRFYSNRESLGTDLHGEMIKVVDGSRNKSEGSYNKLSCHVALDTGKGFRMPCAGERMHTPL